MKVSNELSNHYLAWAEEIVGASTAVQKEVHGDEGAVFRLATTQGNFFLKIGRSFESENAKLEYLENSLPVPRVIDSIQEIDSGAILLSEIEGKNLKVLSQEWLPDKVIDALVDALHHFHAAQVEYWPFEKETSGKVLVRGDACLPNFIFSDGLLSGYVDVGDARVANPEIDLAAGIWSLQYNLGPGYGARFLEKYGYQDTSEGTVEELRLQYEKYQQVHGFLLDM